MNTLSLSFQNILASAGFYSFFLMFLLCCILIVLSKRSRNSLEQVINFKSLNKKYDNQKKNLNRQLGNKKSDKKNKTHIKNEKIKKECIFIEFNGDIKATQVNTLREKVTAILQVANQGDEVLLRLTSPGGLVSSYGLAASQLQRFREKNPISLLC